MPVYKLNGEVYDIPKDVVADFEKDNPSATITYYAGSDEYEIPVSEREGFLKEFPNARTEAQPMAQEPAPVEQPQPMPQEPYKPTPDEMTGFYGTINSVGRQVSGVNEGLDKLDQSLKGRMKNLGKVPKVGESRNVVEAGEHYNPETNEFEKTYLTSMGQEFSQKGMAEMQQAKIDQAERDERYRQSLPGQLEDAYAQREKLKAELRKDETEEGVPKGFLTSLYQAGKSTSSKANTDYETKKAALRQVEKRINTLEAERDNAGFWSALATDLGVPESWAFGITELADAGKLLGIKYKIDKAKKEGTQPVFTDAEQFLLRETLLANAAEQEFGDNRDAWYRAGKMAATSIQMMPDFIVGMGPMKAIASGTIKVFTKAGAKMLGKEMAEKWIPRAIIKTTGMTAGTLAAGAAMVNTIQIPKLAGETIKNMTGELTLDENGNYVFGTYEQGDDGEVRFVEDTDSFVPALLKAEQKLIPEASSEVLGEFLPGAGQVLNKLGLSKITKQFSRLTGSKWYKGYSDVLHKTGFHGVPGEMVEEYANDVHSLIIGDPEGIFGNEQGKGGWADPEKHIDIALGCATLGAMLNAPRIAGTAFGGAQYARYKHNVDKADVRAAAVLGDDNWQMIRESIDNCDNENIAALANSILSGDMTTEQKRAAWDYLYNLQKMRGYSLGAISENAEQKEDNELNEWIASVEQSYTEGHEAEAPDEMKDIIEGYRAAEEGLKEQGEQFAIMVQAERENPANLLDYLLSNRDTFSDSQIAAAADYLQKQARANGVLDAEMDKVDLGVERANAEVRSNTHQQTGMVVTAQSGDEAYYVLGGNFATDETGEVLPAMVGTGGAVVLKNMQTGEVVVKSPSDVTVLTMQPSDELIQQNETVLRDQLMQQADDEVTYGSPANEVFDLEDTVTLNDGNGGVIEGTIVGVPNAVDGVFAVQTTDNKVLQMTGDELNTKIVAHNGQEIKAQPQMQAETEVQQQMQEPAPQQSGNDYADGEASRNETRGNEPSAAANSALTRIPVRMDANGQPVKNRKGNPVLDWHKASVKDATDALIETTGGDMITARDTATDLVNSAKVVLEKIRKQRPKGDDPIEIAESRLAIKRQEEEQQAIIAQWQKVGQTIRQRMEDEAAAQRAAIEAAKSEEQRAREAEERRKQQERSDEISRARARAKLEEELKNWNKPYQPLVQAKREMAGASDAMAILEDTEPRSIEEWVSSLLTPQSLMWNDEERNGRTVSGLKSELGLQWSDVQRFGALIGGKGKGKPFGEVVHDIWENLPEGMKEMYSDQDVRNIVIDLFNESDSKRMRNLAAEHRIEEARAMMQENQRRDAEEELEAWAEFYHLTPEERETFEDYLKEPPTLIEQDIINQIIADNEQNRTSTAVGEQPISGTDAGSIEGGEDQVQQAAEAAGNGNNAQAADQGTEASTGQPSVADNDVPGTAQDREALAVLFDQIGASPILAERMSDFDVEQLTALVEDWELANDEYGQVIERKKNDLKSKKKETREAAQKAIDDAQEQANAVFVPIEEYVEGLNVKYGIESEEPFEGAIPTPKVDRPRYDANRQALINAYMSGDPAAITQAAQAIQQYVDEGLDAGEDKTEMFDIAEDYDGNDPEKLADQYIIRTFWDRYLDDDADQEYIKTGLSLNMRKAMVKEVAMRKAMVKEVAGRYKSLAPIFTVDSYNLTDEELTRIAGKELTAEELEEGREKLRDYKKPAFYNPETEEIIIFADKLDPSRIEECLFHENIHRGLEKYLGENINEITEEFWNNSTSEASEANKKKIAEMYKDEPESIKEEYLTSVFGVNLTKGTADKLFERLSAEHREVIENILTDIGYDRAKETAEQTKSEEANVLGQSDEENVSVPADRSTGRVIQPSEQLKPTDMRDAVRVESPEIGVSEANARAQALSEGEAMELMRNMEASATPDPQISLTPETWAQTFGLNNSLETPIGNVKMGEGQYQKFFDKSRSMEFGMAVETLKDPDVVMIEPSQAKEGQTTERFYSYIFIKTFDRNGEKIKYYASVTVQRDNMEVSVSSHYMKPAKVYERLTTLERLYTKETLLPNSSEWHLAEQQDAVPDLLPTQENNVTSASKVTDNSSNIQENLGKTSSQAEISFEEGKVDTNPTEAQKEAGNYKKGHIQVDGYDITIENPKGSIRRGTDADGKQWEQEMHNTYGYIRGTEGADGDHIDVFLSDNPTHSDKVFIVQQRKKVNGIWKFDELKVLLGFNSASQASNAYLSNYEKGWDGMSALIETDIVSFKDWLKNGNQKGTYKEDGAWAKVYPGVSDMVADEGEMPEPEQQEVQVLRREGNNRLPGMGGELSEVPGGHGQETIFQSDTGQNRREQGVLQGELQVDGLDNPVSEPKNSPLSDIQGENNVNATVGSRNGSSTEENKIQNSDIPLERRENTGNSGRDQGQLQNDYLSGQNDENGRLGEGTQPELQNAEEQGETGLDNGKDSRDTSEHKADGNVKATGRRESVLMGAVVDKMRESGIDVSTDWEEGQKVLDDYNSRHTAVDAENMVKAQKVTDKKTLDELNNGKTVKRYRAMQLIDGKLYPPMSAKVDGEMRQPTGIGVWEQSEERPDLIKDGKFVLNKGQKGQGNVPAAYNPYFHTSTSGLNDQFTSAYKRPELVVVEVEIPESELTSGYKAEGAKDAVGNVDWHSGVVNGQLPADRQRQVTLSRYSKVNRIVPDSEVADMIAKQLEGTNVEVPYNVVTPQLRKELEARGVKISNKPAGSVTEDINGNPINKETKLFKTTDGHAYGYTYQGKIYVDPRIATTETPIHEYSHLWVEMKRQLSPEEWNDIKQIMLNDKLVQPIIEKVKQDYPELTKEGKEDSFAEEVITQFSGKRGNERLQEIAKEIAKEKGGVFGKAEAVTAIQRLRNILNRFWEGVAKMMGWKYTNANQIADRIMVDMLNSVDPLEEIVKAKTNVASLDEIKPAKVIYLNAKEVRMPKMQIEDFYTEGLKPTESLNMQDRVNNMSPKELVKQYKRLNEQMLDENGLNVDEQEDAFRQKWFNEHGLEGFGPASADFFKQLTEKYTFNKMALRWDIQDRIKELGLERYIDKEFEGSVNIDDLPDDKSTAEIIRMQMVGKKGAENADKVERDTRRMDMSEEERMTHTLEETEGVYRNDQVVIMGNGTSMNINDVKPIDTGDFGNIYDQFKGKPKEAVDFLLKKREGEVLGALSHKDVGEIDLVWGEEGTGKSDGFGLAKLAKYHPEVLNNLQEILDDMHVVKRTPNRINLESDTHKAAVRLTWNEKKKNWLLTAFEKKNSALDNTTDTGKTSDRGKRNDTATPQSTVSGGKGTDNIRENQGNDGISSGEGPKLQKVGSRERPHYQPGENAMDFAERLEEYRREQSMGEPEEVPVNIARQIYEDAVRDTGEQMMIPALLRSIGNKEQWTRFKHKFAESWFDYSRSIKALQDAIEKATGKAVEGFEDVWRTLNAKSSIDSVELQNVMNDYIMPLSSFAGSMVKDKKIDGRRMTVDDVEKYMNAVHGIERNVAMAMKEARNEYEEDTALQRQQLENGELDARERKSLEAALLIKEARFKGIKDYMDNEDVSKWWNLWVNSVERGRAKGTLSEEEYEKTRRKMDEEYNRGWQYKYRDKDYSGLTGLFGEDFKEDAQKPSEEQLEQAARDFAAKFEDIVGKEQADKLWELVKALNDWSLRKSYESGLISKDQYNDTMSMYEHYVPLRGWHDDYAGDVYQYISRGEPAEVLQGVLKKAYGRKSRAARLFGTMAAMANTAIVQGNRNNVAQHLLNMAMNHQDSGLLMVSEQYYQKTADDNLVPLTPNLRDDMTAEEMVDELERFEEDMKAREEAGEVQPLRKKFKKEFPLHMAKWQEQRHAVRVLRGGKEYMVYVLGNPRAAEAFNGLLNPHSEPGAVSDVISRYMRFLAKMQTSLSPEFLVSNFQRDVLTASTGAYVKFGKDYQKRFVKNLASVMPLTAIASIRKGKKAENLGGIFSLFRKYDSGTLDMSNDMERMFKEFIDGGGMTGISYITKSEEYQASMEKIVKRMREGKMGKVKNAAKAISEAVEFANKGIENATRFATYMTSRQQGRSIRESVFDAKEGSVNFNMKGSGAWGNMQARKMYLYVNPAMQALRMLGTWYENDPMVTVKKGGEMVTKAVGSRFMKAAALTLTASVSLGMLNIMLSELLHGDDDDDKKEGDWWALSEWNRYNFVNFINPFGKGYFHWSLPQEIRPVWALGQIAIDMAYGRVTWQRGMQSMLLQMNNLSPLSFFEGGTDTNESIISSELRTMTPSYISPFTDAYLWNRDFMGHPITNQNSWNKEAPEWQRAGKNTPKMLIEASRQWNELTGGRRNKKSWADSPYLNPSAVYYLLTQQFGGMGSMAKRMVSAFDQWRDPEQDVESRNLPFVPKFYVTTGDDYSKDRVMNDKFWMYWNEFRDADYEINKDNHDEEMDDAERQKTIKERKADGTYQHWETINDNALDYVYNKVRGTSKEKDVKKMVLDAIESGVKPDYAEEVEKAETPELKKMWETAVKRQKLATVEDIPQEELAKDFDDTEDRQLRQMMATRISKDAGASKDPYGKKSKSPMASQYQKLRTAEDIREDALLFSYQEKADAEGNEELAEKISKDRESVRRNAAKYYGLGKPYGRDENAMNFIRRWRKKLLEKYAPSKKSDSKQSPTNPDEIERYE